jgi:hypothetical protein
MEQQQRRPGAGAQMDRGLVNFDVARRKPQTWSALRIGLTEQIGRQRSAGC